MNEPNKQFVYFSLVGFTEDPADITAVLGLKPTKVWRKGDTARGCRERCCNRWSLSSRLPKTNDDFEVHIADVLDQLDTRKEAVSALCQRTDAVMQLVGYFHVNYPGLVISAELIERMEYYHLRLDCDFYYLYGCNREDTY